jgi:hypothetical protein
MLYCVCFNLLCNVWVCVCVGSVMCGCVYVSVFVMRECVYVWVLLCVGVFMCGFCNVCLCVCVGFVTCGCVSFVMCGSVYVWVFW